MHHTQLLVKDKTCPRQGVLLVQWKATLSAADPTSSIVIEMLGVAIGTVHEVPTLQNGEGLHLHFVQCVKSRLNWGLNKLFNSLRPWWFDLCSSLPLGMRSICQHNFGHKR